MAGVIVVYLSRVIACSLFILLILHCVMNAANLKTGFHSNAIACVACVALPTQALTFFAVFVYATHATQAIAFEWKPG